MSKLSKEKFNEEADRVLFKINNFEFTRTHLYGFIAVVVIVGCFALKGMGV